MLLAIYIVGYLWFWRYIAGALMNDVTSTYDAEGFDYIMCVMCASLATLFWPIIVPARLGYVMLQKHGGPSSTVINFLFPPLKEIETAEQKRVRLESEKKQQEFARQRQINERERELGMELTKW